MRDPSEARLRCGLLKCSSFLPANSEYQDRVERLQLTEQLQKEDRKTKKEELRSDTPVSTGNAWNK